MRTLVKTDRADGTIRLAPHPSCINLDRSLEEFEFLGPSMSRGKNEQHSKELERNIAQGLVEARRLLEAIETLGPRAGTIFVLGQQSALVPSHPSFLKRTH